jgi:hypothetical protein
MPKPRWSLACGTSRRGVEICVSVASTSGKPHKVEMRRRAANKSARHRGENAMMDEKENRHGNLGRVVAAASETRQVCSRFIRDYSTKLVAAQVGWVLWLRFFLNTP